MDSVTKKLQTVLLLPHWTSMYLFATNVEKDFSYLKENATREWYQIVSFITLNVEN